MIESVTTDLRTEYREYFQLENKITDTKDINTEKLESETQKFIEEHGHKYYGSMREDLEMIPRLREKIRNKEIYFPLKNPLDPDLLKTPDSPVIIIKPKT